MIVLNDHSFRNKAGRKCIICEDADDRELESKIFRGRVQNFFIRPGGVDNRPNKIFYCILDVSRDLPGKFF